MEPAARTLNLIHYNDVYELRGNDKEICGGADRFCTLLSEVREQHNALVLFSGDLFNPSKLSATYRGEQMVKIVNKIKTAASCLGNHDLVTTFLTTGPRRRTSQRADSNVFVSLDYLQHQDEWQAFGRLSGIYCP